MPDTPQRRELGGRTGCRTPTTVVHYFGTFGSPVTGLDQYPPSPFPLDHEETWSPDGDPSIRGTGGNGPGARTYLVGSAAREVLRYNEDPIPPLRAEQVSTLRGISDPFSWRDDTQLKLRIGVGGGPALRVFYLDVGQQIEVVATTISVRAVTPAGFVEVPPWSPNDVASAAGLVGDVLFGAWATPIEETRGLRSGLYTTNLFIAANQSGSMQIPAGARAVQIYASGTEAALPELRLFEGDPNVLTTGYRVGTITFAAGTFQTERVELPSATHVVAPSVGNDVFLTFVWTIRP